MAVIAVSVITASRPADVKRSKSSIVIRVLATDEFRASVMPTHETLPFGSLDAAFAWRDSEARRSAQACDAPAECSAAAGFARSC